MTRLRVRVELNRRKSGVPMEELASVVEETQKFFHLLAEDVGIPVDRGEWLASNFDPESLNFTAEFNGPASIEQIRDFGAAFGGATSLRRETIAQFTHIADFIGEDELVGFGLYQSDEESEPSDWRCLSRRDAQRFAGEIQLLAKAAGVSEMDSPLPAVMNGSVGGRRLFKDRREREALAADPSKWIREVESSLASRIGLLESKLEAQAQQVQGLGNSQDIAEERFLKLLGVMESAWSQAPRQLTAPAADVVAQSREPREPRNGWKLALGFAAAALILATVGAAQFGPWSRSPELPVVRPIVAPVLAEARVQTVAGAPQPAVMEAESAPKIKPTPPESAAMLHQISLQIPDDLRPAIKEQALVNVSVAIDPKGKVTTAKVESTDGEEADLLTKEALRVARRFRFRPSRQGSKSVASRMVLTFVFDPEPLPGN
ncbi:MAG: TonB family protein [Acidobacteriota bacterium]|nr:TonB family protein [Acidobacteriota bacterium]